MSALRVIALFGLIALFVGVVALGDAQAGEKFRGRSVMYFVKWERIDVPGEEKHFVVAFEAKGINSNKEGKAYGEANVLRQAAILDIDLKTEEGYVIGYEEATDRDGNKIYSKFEGRREKGAFWQSQWKGETTILRGTGKYEGIRGKGTYTGYPIAPMQSYSDWEMEVELPR